MDTQRRVIPPSLPPLHVLSRLFSAGASQLCSTGKNDPANFENWAVRDVTSSTHPFLIVTALHWYYLRLVHDCTATRAPPTTSFTHHGAPAFDARGCTALYVDHLVKYAVKYTCEIFVKDVLKYTCEILMKYVVKYICISIATSIHHSLTPYSTHDLFQQ